MLVAGIAFLTGVILFQQLPALPVGAWWWVLLPAIALCTCCSRFGRLVAYLLAGFCWAFYCAELRMEKNLPGVLEGQDLQVVGVIAKIPEPQGRLTRFVFDIEQQGAAMAKLPLPLRVRLNWYGDPPDLQAGDRWQFTVRLKAPHGFMNPGGFDYEGWLFAQGIAATGYVRAQASAVKLGKAGGFYTGAYMRQKLLDKLSESLEGRSYSGVIMALVLGERQEITTVQWQWLRATGTSHLIAISGLHIGLLATLGFYLATGVWYGLARLAPTRMEHIPKKSFAALFALLVAGVYAALAGFALPTLRAWIMLAVVAVAMLWRRQWAPSSAFGLALLAILLLDPLAVNTPGFWLSFLAVGVLIYLLLYRRGPFPVYRRWLTVQCGLVLALLPVSLVWFQQAALAGAGANFIAIPLVGLLVVPMALFGSVLLLGSESLGSLLLQGADQLLHLLFLLLQWLAQQPLAQWQQHNPPIWSWPFAALAVGLLLAPRGFPGRYLGMVLLAPVFFSMPSKPQPGELWFTLLDVGQGLAAVLETEQHVLVYDSGAKFSDTFNIGTAVVLPFLRARGWRQVDNLIISHADNDHAGGAAALLAEMPADVVYSGEVARLASQGIAAQACLRGQQWHWDGVAFEILSPDASLKSGNNASCVLKVSVGEYSLLLPGDIEKQVETNLLRGQQGLQADIIVAPHHGSRSSSTRGFVDAVAAEYVLFAAGYRNRYGFPKEDVMQRYVKHAKRILISYRSGAIQLRLSVRGIEPPRLYRQRQQRYWHHRLGSTGQNEYHASF